MEGGLLKPPSGQGDSRLGSVGRGIAQFELNRYMPMPLGDLEPPGLDERSDSPLDSCDAPAREAA